MKHTWHIIGRGAIGLLWAQQLKQLKQSVRLIVKGVDTPKQQSIECTHAGGNVERFTVSLSKHQDKAPISHLVVPLKAYDVFNAIEQVKHRLTPDSVIILCHNGMGTIAPVRKMLGDKQPLLFATTTHGAYRKANYQVVHSGLGETKMGWISKNRCRQTEQLLTGVLPAVSWYRDIEQILWQKLAINCVINPLTALENCRNGHLADDSYRQQIAILCEEISTVANACGIALTRETLIDNSYKVIMGTAENYSSMNRDVAAGRQTEIDFITGYLLAKAQAHDIKIPVNQSLFDQVKALESV